MTITLITGVNSGLGFATARKLLEEGYAVIGTVRDQAKSQVDLNVLQSIENGKLTVFEMDLTSLQSVQTCAEKIIKTHEKIDTLIFNAGIMTPPHSITENRFESQFQINYLSHFYLFSLLQEVLLNSETKKVISISSLSSEKGINATIANFEKDDREDLGQNWLPNNGSGLINESRVLESDLIEVRDALLAVGYDPGAYEGFTHKTESTKGIFKLDWNINDNNRLALIYNFLDASKEKPAHPTALGFRGPSASTLQFENAGYQINNKLQSFQMELNSDFEGNASNKFQVGYTHFNDFRNPKSTPAPSLTITKDGSNYIIAGHEPFSINNDLQQKVFTKVMLITRCC